MTIGELLVKIGFEADTLKLNEFVKDLGELNMSSVIAAAGFKEMVDGLTGIMKTADATVSSLNKLSGITGVQASVFQQWDSEAQKLNVDAGVTSQTISDIQENIQLARNGQGNLAQAAAVFGPRGVQFVGRENDPAGVLHDILKSMEGIDPAMRRLMLHSAGLNEELSLMVGHEDDVFNQAHNTSEQFASVQKFITDIRQLTRDWLVVIVGLGAALAPVLDFFIQIADSVANFLMYLEQAFPLVTTIAATILTLVTAMKGLAVISGFVAGLSQLRFLLPVFEGLALVLTKLSPLLGIISLVGLGGGLLFDLLKPKDSGNNNVNSSGDFNQNNTYNISGNDPNSIAQRIAELHESQHRDVQSQSPLTSY